jgi:hypothetical protein
VAITIILAAVSVFSDACGSIVIARSEGETQVLAEEARVDG